MTKTTPTNNAPKADADNTVAFDALAFTRDVIRSLQALVGARRPLSRSPKAMPISCSLVSRGPKPSRLCRSEKGNPVMADTAQKTFYLLHAAFRDGSFVDDFSEDEHEAQQRFHELSHEADCRTCSARDDLRASADTTAISDPEVKRGAARPPFSLRQFRGLHPGTEDQLSRLGRLPPEDPEGDHAVFPDDLFIVRAVFNIREEPRLHLSSGEIPPVPVDKRQLDNAGLVLRIKRIVDELVTVRQEVPEVDPVAARSVAKRRRKRTRLFSEELVRHVRSRVMTAGSQFCTLSIACAIAPSWFPRYSLSAHRGETHEEARFIEEHPAIGTLRHRPRVGVEGIPLDGSTIFVGYVHWRQCRISSGLWRFGEVSSSLTSYTVLTTEILEIHRHETGVSHHGPRLIRVVQALRVSVDCTAS
ncbi:hypothetical protein, partial [Methyloceanibacter stevinii]|uniref:hypothetical protein n=1 Tax=Methyloceanibacter stevinii TaxID=1774970 RepID=UPI0019D3D4FF